MIRAGDPIPVWEAVADPERMKTMALLLRDPNPIHWDVDAVRRLGLGERPVNQGPNNMAYLINALHEWTGDPTCLRSITVRFLAPVYAGQQVTVSGEVAAVDADGLTCQLWLDADGQRAATAEAVIEAVIAQ